MKRWLSYWSGQGVKSDGFFSTSGYLGDQRQHIMNRTEKMGKVYGGYTPSFRFIVINDPELVKEVLIKNFDVFPNRLHINMGPSTVVKKNLFFMAGDEDWKRMRTIVTPAFTSSKLRLMTSQFSWLSDELVNTLNKLEMKGIAKKSIMK